MYRSGTNCRPFLAMLRFNSDFLRGCTVRTLGKISNLRLACLFLLTGLLFVPYMDVSAEQPAAKGHEVSETDGVPVLIKHLPGWESKRDSAVLASSVAELKNVLGDRPVLDAIDFRGGTEAVVAPYEEAKLLIVEFATPQGSAAADDIVQQRLVAGPQGGPVVYRRIGNYNAFV